MQEKMRQCSSLKALQIIDALSEGADVMSISDLCDKTGLSASTVHRILQELLKCDFVAKDDGQHKYRIGVEALALGMRLKASDYLLAAALPEMRKLNGLTSETIHLIGEENFQATYLGKLEAKNQIGLRSRVGRLIPLHCTSGGKIILAYKSSEWLEEYFQRVTRTKFTEYTLTRRDELIAEIQRIRERGYAMDIREHHPDIICVSAPVFRRENEFMCAVSIAAPDYRFSEERALSFVPALKAHTAAISARLN